MVYIDNLWSKVHNEQIITLNISNINKAYLCKIKKNRVFNFYFSIMKWNIVFDIILHFS